MTSSTDVVVIVCSQPGFRRAGMAHPARAEYPAGFFSAEQMATLRMEPRLVVTVSQAAPAAPSDETSKQKAKR